MATHYVVNVVLGNGFTAEAEGTNQDALAAWAEQYIEDAQVENSTYSIAFTHETADV